MKKIILSLGLAIILVVGLCACGTSKDTSSPEVDNSDINITLFEDSNISIIATSYDDNEGYFGIEVNNKTDYKMDCYSDVCTVDGESADFGLWCDTIAPNAKCVSNEVLITDSDWNYYTLSGEWQNYEIGISYDYYSDDMEIYEDNNITFTITPSMFGY